MEPDIALITGAGLAVLSLPSIIAAWAEGRAPRVGALVLLTGGGLILWAMARKPGGYALLDLPDIFYGVIGGML